MKINRLLNPKILELAKKFPVISIMGPRQSGKTTLAKMSFPKYKYFNLEDPLTIEMVTKDPRAFIKNSAHGIIIDEVQKFPELLSYIQIYVDENTSRGKIVITGSENLLLSEKISQSLAGRVAIFTLLPLALKELKTSYLKEKTTEEIMLNGFYPAVYSEKINPSQYFSNYMATYIERDVRQIKNIGNLSLFRKFVISLASRVGNVLNIESLTNDLGIDNKTILSWLSILEATYIIFRLSPFFQNYGKRLIKQNKLYFYDTGLVAYLLGIKTGKELNVSPIKGQLFENLVVAELYKTKFNSYSMLDFYFWRDSNQVEVDILTYQGEKILPIEIKSSQTYSSEFIRAINLWEAYTTYKVENKLVIYDGKDEFDILGCRVINWRNIPTDLIVE
jgi:hypothetical protein